MGIMDLFKRKNNANVDYARSLAIAQSQINRGTEQLEMELNLGVKDAIIRDKGAEAIYDSETYNYQIERNEKGDPTLSPMGPNYNGQALRLLLSSKLSLGFIDAKEARRELLLGEREFINIEMNCEEHDYHLGMGSRFTAQNIHMRQGILGSVEGKTARNLLITPHVTRVEAGEIPKKKGASIL